MRETTNYLGILIIVGLGAGLSLVDQFSLHTPNIPNQTASVIALTNVIEPEIAPLMATSSSEVVTETEEIALVSDVEDSEDSEMSDVTQDEPAGETEDIQQGNKSNASSSLFSDLEESFSDESGSSTEEVATTTTQEEISSELPETTIENSTSSASTSEEVLIVVPPEHSTTSEQATSTDESEAPDSGGENNDGIIESNEDSDSIETENSEFVSPEEVETESASTSASDLSSESNLESDSVIVEENIDVVDDEESVDIETDEVEILEVDTESVAQENTTVYIQQEPGLILSVVPNELRRQCVGGAWMEKYVTREDCLVAAQEQMEKYMEDLVNEADQDAVLSRQELLEIANE